MLLSVADCKALVGKLDAARAAGTDNCMHHHVGADGKPYKLVAKPRAKKANLIAALGAENVVEQGGVLYAKVALGVHGRGHLGIDPATGKVGCVLCAGKK